jgi:hypothetical protein
VTRLLLSLLRLLAANRSAAHVAARGRGAGQYRRLVPAAAEAGHGPAGGYRHPDRDSRRYSPGHAGSGATWVGGERRHGDGFDDADEYPDSVGFRAASRSSGSAVPRGREGHSASRGAGSRGRTAAGARAAGAGGYQHRGRGAAETGASDRAGQTGWGGGGRSRLGGRAAGGAGVIPPGEPYTTDPFTTEPFAAGPRDGLPGGQPLTGTVHRPERGGRGPGSGWGGDSGWGPGGRRPRRRWIPLRYKWIAALVVLGLIFRRAVAWAVLFALSAALHLVGVGVHLPSIKFGWPWQSVTSNSTTTTPVGPWVLQKIEGISKPALGRVNFNFVFTRKVSKSIGPWPCWYQSTFAAVGHASATVALNPGSAWWAPGTGHYNLRVLSAPQGGKPGHLSVRMMLPMPQLPQSAHDVTIDDLPSKPIDVQHSWTYPGFGCGTLLKPQFDNSVLYAEAQQIAFYKSTHVAQVTKPLMAAAEAEAVQTVRDNFVQPTVNALGYTLDEFTIAWVSR